MILLLLLMILVIFTEYVTAITALSVAEKWQNMATLLSRKASYYHKLSLDVYNN